MSKRKMKDSGAEWLGEIPAEWNVGRVKNDFCATKEIAGAKADSYQRLALTLSGVVMRSKEDAGGLQPEEFEGYQVLRKNELVFKLIDLQNVKTSRVGRSPFEIGIVSPAYIVLRHRHGADTRYAEYFFLSMWMHEVFNTMGDDAVRSCLNRTDLLHIPFLMPSENEQRKIAEYLDARCAKIDEMVSDAKKTIEEYKAWKASVIFESVTGKNTGSKMKDSGVEWIGRMPDGWRVIPVRYLLVEKNVRSEAGLEEPLSMSQVHGVVPSKMITVANPASSYVGAKVLSVGDLVFNKLKAHLGVFAISRYAGLVSPDYAVYQSRGICDMSLLMWAFHTPQCISEFKKNVTGIGAGLSRLYTSDLYRIKVPVPSVEEQLRLVDFLDKKCAAIDRVISAKESLIADLEAYKKSLIFECVTGKMEVA